MQYLGLAAIDITLNEFPLRVFIPWASCGRACLTHVDAQLKAVGWHGTPGAKSQLNCFFMAAHVSITVSARNGHVKQLQHILQQHGWLTMLMSDVCNRCRRLLLVTLLLRILQAPAENSTTTIALIVQCVGISSIWA